MYDVVVCDPAILGGKPIIRGTRISVAMILEWLASGASREGIVRRYPQLTPDHVSDALTYAAGRVRDHVELTVGLPS